MSPSSIVLTAVILTTGLAACSAPATQAPGKQSDSTTATVRSTGTGDWTGSWSRNEWQNDAWIDIDSQRGDRLYFRMTATNGGHTGELEGTATLNKGIADFLQQDEYDTCRLRLRAEGDSAIVIEQLSGNCGAAMGVRYDGLFRRGCPDALQNRSQAQTLLSLGVFSDPEDDDRFRALTAEGYEDFVVTTQLTADDVEDLDGFGAKVRTSGIRGLFTEMEHIIMTDASNRIWAAVVNGDTVKYYTNTRTHRKQLPKTIDAWRERFSEKVVSYESAQ